MTVVDLRQVHRFLVISIHTIDECFFILLRLSSINLSYRLSIMQDMDVKLEAAINYSNANIDEDNIVDTSPESPLQKMRQYDETGFSTALQDDLCGVSENEKNPMDGADNPEQRYKYTQLEIDDYKRKLLDKNKHVEVIREELMKLQTTGRKLNDQMRRGK